MIDRRMNKHCCIVKILGKGGKKGRVSCVTAQDIAKLISSYFVFCFLGKDIILSCFVFNALISVIIIFIARLNVLRIRNLKVKNNDGAKS